MLIEWSNGDRDALDKLIPLVYAELRQIALGGFATRAPRPYPPTDSACT